MLINDGMDAYVLDREGQVSSQTLFSELGDVTACLGKASRKHRLGWKIELPEIKPTPSNPDPQHSVGRTRLPWEA
jgi:hypothetical protein